MKTHLSLLLFLSLCFSSAFAQKEKSNLRAKLVDYYQVGKLDMKNQAPGAINFGFGQGLQITSKDSTARLKMEFRFQSLFYAQKELNTSDKIANGFLIRRSRLKFGGFAFTPNLQYKVELGLSNRDISPSSDFNEVGRAPKLILDAVLKWKFHKNFTLWAGQTKLPGNRERVISSQKLQFVDRSNLNSKFNLDRDMGVQLHSQFNAGKTIIRVIGAISTGEGRNITAGNIGGFGYTGRFEFLPMGAFASKGDYFGSDLKREQKPKLSLGISYDYNNNSSRSNGRLGKFITDDEGNYIMTDLSSIMADLMFKYKGFSVMAEMAQRTANDDNLGFATGTALSGQMGYLINAPKFKNWELAVRYTKLNPDSFSSLTETGEYTFGISKYVLNHNLKIQTDVSLLDVAGQDNLGIRYRLQTEFAF